MMWEMADQGADDVSQFLGHPICNGPPTRDTGPKGVPVFMNFW